MLVVVLQAGLLRIEGLEDQAPLGLAGLVISWAFFYKFMRANGLAFEYFWEEALWTGDSTGLVWDLLATGGIVTVMALYRRRTLGALRLAIVLACTLVLGVCVGLAALCAFLHATPQTPRRG